MIINLSRLDLKLTFCLFDALTFKLVLMYQQIEKEVFWKISLSNVVSKSAAVL